MKYFVIISFCTSLSFFLFFLDIEEGKFKKSVDEAIGNSSPIIKQIDSLLITRYLAKADTIKTNLLGLLHYEEKVEFIEDLNLSTDKMHVIELPSDIRKKIFAPLMLDLDVIECRVFLYGKNTVLFGMNNLNDSLSCIYTIKSKEETEIDNIKDRTSWGTAHQLMLVSPEEIKNRKFDFPLKNEKNAIPSAHFFRKEIKVKPELNFTIELFLHKSKKAKIKQM